MSTHFWDNIKKFFTFVLQIWDACVILIVVIFMSEISKRLYQAIISKNYSYGDMAKLTGIPKSAIQRYATGETEKIPLDRLEKMAAVLDVSSSYLMGWDESTVTATTESTSEAELPEITMIARAGKKMSPERRADMLKMLKIAFPEAFSEDD